MKSRIFALVSVSICICACTSSTAPSVGKSQAHILRFPLGVFSEAHPEKNVTAESTDVVATFHPQ
jgi:hypothetical protein